MNIFNPSLFAVRAPCMPCCTAPTECACALLIPPANVSSPGPYASLSDAQAAIANLVSNCIGFTGGFVVNPTSFVATYTSPDSLELNTSTAAAEGAITSWASINAPAGAVLTVDFSVSGTLSDPAVIAILFQCDGTSVVELLEDDSGSPAGTLTFSALASDGEYIIYLTYFGGPSSPFSADFVITSSATLMPNPVIALWDDSGTTRQLEACPKMLLPPLTENTGNWYADCASAAAVITSIQVSNCIGYSDDSFSTTFAFTATDAGTSLTLAGSANAGGAGLVCWASLNAEVGKTITVTWSNSIGGAAAIYDQYGNLVDGNTPFGDPSAFTSMALPATGRYTIYTQQFTDLTNPPGSAIITSSGAMSVNPIQALYDAGLTCPARLNCGDTCP